MELTAPGFFLRFNSYSENCRENLSSDKKHFAVPTAKLASDVLTSPVSSLDFP